ncbi:type II toxin-antitoxin system RelE/ParE family toxin [Phreatobacter stygius]|uniref:Type II toxin-antitoxin system RelE/ParE family toxin n=1 Tax=Phreatobacter stygius TaxID=1940610 RepID=A0A4D7AW97_9HYPH|nr:type II toxin-antitoxin system RelE/ParE family toxin [Phreatobacter stygius]QCI65944.1 type II toxin-antitoxin system RelE/ParE family toxin [Phreatobacter stygius]
MPPTRNPANLGASRSPDRGAEADLKGIYAFIRDQASPRTARSYVDRILTDLAGFDLFPERGTVRDEIRPGLRVIGFARRISIAFIVEAEEVVVLRILYAGRQLEIDEE